MVIPVRADARRIPADGGRPVRSLLTLHTPRWFLLSLQHISVALVKKKQKKKTVFSFYTDIVT